MSYSHKHDNNAPYNHCGYSVLSALYEILIVANIGFIYQSEQDDLQGGRGWMLLFSPSPYICTKALFNSRGNYQSQHSWCSLKYTVYGVSVLRQQQIHQTRETLWATQTAEDTLNLTFMGHFTHNCVSCFLCKCCKVWQMSTSPQRMQLPILTLITWSSPWRRHVTTMPLVVSLSVYQ